MIWALLAIFFLGGGGDNGSGNMLTPESLKQLSARTESVIKDQGREKAAQQTLNNLQMEVKAFEKVFSKSGKQLSKFYEAHDTDGEQLSVILDNLNSDWKSSQQRTLDMRFELKESMTEEEWSALFVTE